MLNFIVALMVMPMEAIMLPLYIEMSQFGWVDTLAALVVSAIPMLVMFIFMQKYYIEGIASSGIKG